MGIKIPKNIYMYVRVGIGKTLNNGLSVWPDLFIVYEIGHWHIYKYYYVNKLVLFMKF